MEETRKVVEALMRIGPRFSDISKATGVPVSTVRYILLNRFPRLGLTVRASINYGALGLQRYLVEFRSKYPAHYISRLLDLLGESMYLDYYTYSMTMKKFSAFFAVPPKYESSFSEFLDAMESLGLIEDLDFRKLTYMRLVPFMSEYFDFSRGIWAQSWMTNPKPREIPEIPEYPDPKPKIDKIDLMMLAQLQKEVIPLKYSELARKFNLTRQTISKHYRRVKRLISSFAVIWVPFMNPELVVTPIIVKADASEAVRKTLLSIPFTYTEFRSERGEYYAMLIIPAMGFYTTLKFLSERIDVEELSFQDMEYSGKFAIQHSLYKEGGWIDVFEISLKKLIQIIHKKEFRSFSPSQGLTRP